MIGWDVYFKVKGIRKIGMTLFLLIVIVN